LHRIPLCEVNLPDILTCMDGEIITDSVNWYSKRRPEILQLFRDEVYGQIPDYGDLKVNFRVANVGESNEIMAGKAVRKTIEISATRAGRHFYFPLHIFIPKDNKEPVPAILTICNRGIKDADPARHFLSPFWPAETIIARGYAAAVILTHDIAPDFDEGFTMGFHKLFPYAPGQRPRDAWGAISAWAWGASRVMDYLVTDPAIDQRRVAVVGHSRGGKTALWCAAQDERFAMAVSSSAGTSGDAITRGKSGEQLRDIVERFPYWFCNNYQKYSDHEDALPLDQHMLLGLIAPRLLYISAKSFDSWADPVRQFESCVAAGKVYGLFGLDGITEPRMPRPETPLLSGEIGFHLKTGEHNMDEYDWDCYLDFADRHLKSFCPWEM
jgi:pimeloyl-ACP methyl ester carboxylesterase